MSKTPVAIDPSRVLEFVSTSSCPPDELRSFLGLFESFSHGEEVDDSQPKKPLLRMFIIRQPKPSRYLRGDLEREFLSKREGLDLINPQLNKEIPKDAVYIAIEYDRGSFSSESIANIGASDVELNHYEDSGPSISWHPTFPIFPLNQPASGNIYYEDPRLGSASLNAWFEQFYPASFYDESSDDPRQAKKARESENKSNSTTKRKNRECHIWVVAFLAGYFNEPQAQPQSASYKEIPVTSALQAQESTWTLRATDLLETSLMREFVKSEVLQGRIGIDYKPVVGK